MPPTPLPRPAARPRPARASTSSDGSPPEKGGGDGDSSGGGGGGGDAPGPHFFGEADESDDDAETENIAALDRAARTLLKHGMHLTALEMAHELSELADHAPLSDDAPLPPISRLRWGTRARARPHGRPSTSSTPNVVDVANANNQRTCVSMSLLTERVEQRKRPFARDRQITRCSRPLVSHVRRHSTAVATIMRRRGDRGGGGNDVRVRAALMCSSRTAVCSRTHSQPSAPTRGWGSPSRLTLRTRHSRHGRRATATRTQLRALRRCAASRARRPTAVARWLAPSRCRLDYRRTSRWLCVRNIECIECIKDDHHTRLPHLGTHRSHV